jgi:ribonuclease H / adenosylcobalamin/alpha-ribazole phosphatase
MAHVSLVIHTDGGSRGNPGPAACGFVVHSESGELIHEGSQYMGESTNNMAEYQGVIVALEWLIANRGRLFAPHLLVSLTFYLDSLLVVNQIMGRYKVREPRFLPLLATIHQLTVAGNFAVTYQAVPREQNRHADRLVNQALDASV